MTKLGKVRVTSGEKWAYGNVALSVQTKLGRLVAFPTGDDGIYDEIEVNLVRDDGKVLQLAVIGVNEMNVGMPNPYPDTEPDYQPTHIYCFDGEHEDVQYGHYVKVDDDSYWYE